MQPVFGQVRFAWSVCPCQQRSKNVDEDRVVLFGQLSGDFDEVFQALVAQACCRASSTGARSNGTGETITSRGVVLANSVRTWS